MRAAAAADRDTPSARRGVRVALIGATLLALLAGPPNPAAAATPPVGEVNVFVQQNAAPKAKSLDKRLAIPAEWTQFAEPFTQPLDAAPGEASLGFHVGFGPQVIEIADVRLARADGGGGEPAQAVGDALTLANHERESQATAAPVDVAGQPFTRAVRVSVGGPPSQFWRSLLEAPVSGALAKGGRYTVSFSARTVEAATSPFPGRARIVGGNFYADLDYPIRDVPQDRQLLYKSFVYGDFTVRVTGVPPGSYRLLVGNAQTWFTDRAVRQFPVRVDGAPLGEVTIDTTADTFGPQEDAFPLTTSTGTFEVAFTGARLSYLRVVDAAGATVAECLATSRMPQGYLAKQRYFFDPAAVAAGEPAPPWAPQYKIRPDEAARLTPADVVGPDGIVYPDFRYAGLTAPPADRGVVAARAHGAVPDDGADDGAAIERAVAAAAARGGGVVALEAGTYHLDQPVRVTADHIVIRGAGRDATRVVFRFAPKPGELRFGDAADGQRLHVTDTVELYVAHADVESVTVHADDRVVRNGAPPQGDGGRFQLVVRGYELLPKGSPGGRVTLRAEAVWKTGQRATTELAVDVSSTHPRRNRPVITAAFQFTGAADAGAKRKLLATAPRGSNTMRLDDARDLSPGDVVLVNTPPTPSFLARLRTKCHYLPRRSMMVVASVAGDVVTFNQPMRVDWLAEDGTTVTRMAPIRGGGVEGLTMEQANPIWTSLIGVQYAVDCRVRDVRLLKAGQHPVNMDHTKYCEVRDSEFADAWFKGGGGTAYAGFFGFNWDCLMEGVRTTALRHGPCVQWASSGNVIRASTFVGSDLQFHAGWAYENLIEDCVVDARGKQSYGWGVYASVPEADVHGPSGPRNVIRNNDVKATAGGLMMGGLNENWIVTHNRFDVLRYTAIAAKDASFDHVIADNVFVLRNALGDPPRPPVLLASRDCVGIELRRNAFVGAQLPLTAGPGRLAVDEANAVSAAGEPPRPVPAVPSIFLWQKQQGR